MKKSFNIIYNEYYKSIFGFVYRMSFSKNDSEDIVQEVFIKLHNEINKGTNIENIKAWLYKCSLNIFINNKKRKHVIHFTDNINQFEKESDNSLESDILINEKKQKIKEALLLMNEQEQIIINLYNDDFSYKQISEIMEIKYSSVGKTLSRAIEKLSNQLKLVSNGEMCKQRNVV